MNKEEKLSKFLQEAKEKFPQFDYSKVLPFNNQEKEHVACCDMLLFRLRLEDDHSVNT